MTAEIPLFWLREILRNASYRLREVKWQRLRLSLDNFSVYQSLKGLGAQLLPPAKVDITQPSTILPAVEGADAVISLVGILTGTEKQFIDLQEKGGQYVAQAAKDAGVKRVVMVSALGIDGGETP